MGRGFWKDLGKVGLNKLAQPLEMLTGQNFYNPKIEGQGTGKIEQFQDKVSDIGAKILPTVANAIVPGSGTAIQVGRQFMPNIANDGANNSTDGPGANTFTPKAAPTPQNALYEMGGMLGMPVQGAAGPNLYAFDGPSHEQGGMKFNENAEIEKQETIDPKAKYVYSDKIKLPGTDKTFAEESKKWKGTDKDDDITKKTNQLMLDRLRNNQEEIKKQDFDKAVKRFEKKWGGYVREQKAKGGYYTPQEANAAGEKFISKETTYGSSAGNYGGITQYFDGGALLSAFTGGGGGDISSILGMLGGGGAGAAAGGLDLNSILSAAGKTPGIAGGQTGEGLGNIDPNMIMKILPMLGLRDGGYLKQHEDGGFMETMKGFFNPNYQSWTAENDYGADMSTEEGINTFLERQAADKAGTLEQPDRFNFQDLQRGANQAGQYANIFHNLNEGRKPAEYYEANYNPEYDKAIDLVSGMEFDADPQLKEVKGTFDKTKDIIQDMSGGHSGIALANVGGAQIRRDKAIQDILTNKNNIDNKYALTEAEMRAGLGRGKAQEDSLVDMSKLKTDAARRKFTSQGVKDWSQKSQLDIQAANQKERDDQLLELLKGTYGDLSNFADVLGEKKGE